jgi:agmatine deiminase
MEVNSHPVDFNGFKRLILCWPHNAKNWGILLKDIKQLYVALIKNISPHSSVVVCVNTASKQDPLLKSLPKSVEVLFIPSDDIWVRDYGPNIAQQISINWRFNAWGEKFLPYAKDRNFAHEFCKSRCIKTKQENLVFEGGALEHNGKGIAILTRDSVLNHNRNPLAYHKLIQQKLKENYQLQHLITLPKGLFGDHTDGHIDNVCRFIDAQHLLYAMPQNKANPSYSALARGLKILKEYFTSHKLNIQITLINLPFPQRNSNGEWVAYSYLNFIQSDTFLVLPQFGFSMDHDVLQDFKRVLKHKTIYLQKCHSLLSEGGGLHCMSKEIF